ncbi:MAG: hypothetical protein WCJ93_03525 [Methanomicrobiales archaeon]
MRIPNIILVTVLLLMIAVLSVQATPVFTSRGAIDFVGSKAVTPLPENGDINLPISMFGRGVVIPFSLVEGIPDNP